jgi:hypothetical protein
VLAPDERRLERRVRRAEALAATAGLTLFFILLMGWQGAILGGALIACALAGPR